MCQRAPPNFYGVGFPRVLMPSSFGLPSAISDPLPSQAKAAGAASLSRFAAKSGLQQQLQNMYTTGTNLGGISDPDFMSELLQQILKPLTVPACIQSD